MYHECDLIQLSPETGRLFKKLSVNITNHEVRVSHGDDSHSPFGLSYIFTFVGIMKCTLLLLSLQTGRLSQYFCWHQKFLSYISTNLFHYERTLLQLPFETVRLYKKILQIPSSCVLHFYHPIILWLYWYLAPTVSRKWSTWIIYMRHMGASTDIHFCNHFYIDL